jgi:two-component system, OmpR family, sensor histidine kinase BaeS
LRVARRLFLSFVVAAGAIVVLALLAAGGLLVALSLRGETRLAAQLLAIGVVMLVALGVVALVARGFARRHAALHARLLAATEAVGAREPVMLDETAPFEVAQGLRNLARIADARERTERSRRTWLVAIAEEMRVPVEALVAAAEAEGASEARLQPVVRLARIVEDLRAVALADLGRLPVALTPTDPGVLMCNAGFVAQPLADKAGVALELAPRAASGGLPRWDGAQIEQLLGALIEHSLRYTPRGGRILLGAEPRGGAWELTVDDSAPGVDIDLAQQLFEPFYRAADLPEESLAHLSLAFATAQAIVEAHHGRIEASRSPLGGLRVAVVLPGEPPVA